MNIELKQAAQRALLALRNSQPHPSNPFIGLTDKDFIDHEETIRQLRNALQQAATPEPVDHVGDRADMMASKPAEPVGVNQLRKELSDANDFIQSLADLCVKYETLLGYRKTEAPEGASELAEARGESNVNTELDLAMPDSICDHVFVLDPKSSIRICNKCGTVECKKHTRPAPSVLKDDQIAALVNKVRDIARMFHDHQSLRERIAIELVPALKVSQEVKSDAERGRLLIKWLKRYGLLQAEFGQMGAGEKPENWWLLHAPWGIDQTRPFLGHGKTPEQAIDAMLATK